jgi:hypothetical protein
MANVLSSLMVTLGADTAAFQQDMGKAGKTAQTEFEKITDSAKAMGAALAAAFTLDAIKDGVLQAVNFADAMGDMAARTGQSVESLTAMGYAAQFSGSSVDTYAAGVEKLSNNMVSAADGNAAAVKMFSKLGVSATDNTGKLRDSQAVFLDVADAVAGIKSPAEKTAVVMDLFGKSAGPELLQLLNQGSSGITALTTEARQMGAVISSETAAQAGQFNDALDRAKIAANGLYMGIAQEVLPVLNNFSGKATDAATSGGVLEKSATAVGVAFKTVYTGGAVLGNVLGLIGDQLGKVGAMAAAVASGDFDQLSAIWSDRTAVEQYKASILELGNIWNDVGQSAAGAAQAQDRATGGAGGNASAGLPGAGKGKGKPVKTPGAAGKKGSRLDELMADDGIAGVLTDIGYDANQRNSEFEETEARRVQAANESAAQLEYLTNKQREDEAALQAAKRQEIALTKDFFLGGLDQMAQGHGKAAKAAQAVQKAQTLYQIGVNTYSAAMGAYSALAGIPVVGPALGVAAAAAAIAFGGQMMAGVNSGGKPSAPGAPSLPSASGGSASVQPVSMQQPERTQQTILQIPANSLMTGRMIADLLDDALGDGKQLTNLRVQAV